MFILTAQQLEEIKAIIAKHHTALVLKLVGPDALTEQEQAVLDGDPAAAGELLDSIKESYLFGVAQAQAAATLETDYAAFKAWVQKNPTPLSGPQVMAVTTAQQQAGEHIRHLGAKVVQSITGEVFAEDAQARQKLLREVKTETATSIAQKESIGKLKKRLQDKVGDYTRDWNRVAITEKANALNQGVADDYAQKHGDPWVYKQPLPSACKHCLKLHLGPDGHPYIFRLSALQANGTNVGKKAAEWKAVVGTVHPWCQCSLHRVPDGWGFDADGDLVPGGEHGHFQKSLGDLEFDGIQQPIKHRPKAEDFQKATSYPNPAAYSPAGDRGHATGTGVALTIGMQTPMTHLQAAQPRIAWTPQELADEKTRKEQRTDRQFVVRRDAEIYRRIPGVDWSENVYPIDAYQHVEMALDALKQIPSNRRHLEDEISRRMDKVSPNYVDSGRASRGDVGFHIADSGELKARISHTLDVARRPIQKAIKKTPVPWRHTK